MKSFQKLVLEAGLLGPVALSLVIPVLAQQEVDPTWYDPWAQRAAVVTKVVSPDRAKPHKIKVDAKSRARSDKALGSNPSRPEVTERAALVRK